MDNWNFSMAEDTIWSPFGDDNDRADDFMYSDFENVDQILSYVCEQQSIGTEDEIPWAKHQDSDAKNLAESGQYAVDMEVDDSDIAAVVKSALNPITNGNTSNEFKMLGNRYSCEVKRNQTADRTNSSTCGPGQMQISEDQKPFSFIVPCDQPCTSRFSSQQNQWGETYSSSYGFGNPQFRHENPLPPDQCIGRFFDPSSKPVEETIRPYHDALVDEYLHEQANEGGRTDISVQENYCMKQVFSNDATAEATNLLQLHNVMNEIDVGTRQCISKSLYRLARSTIRRPDLSDLGNGNTDSTVARRYQSMERSKRIGEGISTDTNILDQSIAKLLFYKPLDLAATSSAEAMLLRSGMLIGIPL